MVGNLSGVQLPASFLVGHDNPHKHAVDSSNDVIEAGAAYTKEIFCYLILLFQ